MEAKVANSESSFRNLIQDLIKGCKSGDQKAQFKIYKLYFRTMYNLSMSIVNSRIHAAEIMQESFLLAFEKIDTYSGTVSFGDWLQNIVVNLSLDSLDGERNKLTA
jgi:DNA-directed RNA polymerase specialized sigma24 family protein